jgi:hypothetical protein
VSHRTFFWRTMRTAAGGLRDNKLRPVHPGARKVGWYGWESPGRRIGLQVAAAGQLGRLTIRGRSDGQWTTIATVLFEDWFVPVTVLACYGLIPPHTAGLYRQGHADGHRDAVREWGAR